MTDRHFAQKYLEDLCQILPRVDTSVIAQSIEHLRVARDNNKTIYICGNGGSAAIASEMVVDLVKGASFQKPMRFKAMCLSDNISTTTAYANDEGYEKVFVEPLKNFATSGDVLISISGGGNSPNVLAAVQYAKSVGMTTIGITSGEQGALRHAVDLSMSIPSKHMGRLEDAFFIITHILCYAFIENTEQGYVSTDVDELHRQISAQKAEIDWLKKALGAA